MKSTRRSFVLGSVAAGATLLTSRRRVLGANDDVRIALVGIRNQGSGHIKAFSELPGVRVVALCDADRDVLAKRVKQFKDRTNQDVAGYVDVREVLDRDDVDGIVIATPNHWHALMSIWACQAGKDVYVEKPVSHNVWEGRKIVEAARKYDRIVQTGTQNRSSPGLHEAFDYIHQGKIGAIRLVRGLCYKRRDSIGTVDAPQDPPASVDYNLWSGPAPMEPIMRRQFHYDWHWFWTTGNSDIGNQGVHEMDMARWALRQDTLPERVVSFGGRFGYQDSSNTPNTQVAFYDYKPAPLLFEVRGLPRSKGSNTRDDYRSVRVGIVVHCEDGYFAGNSSGGWIYDNGGQRIQQFSGPGGRDHRANFIAAMRTRRKEDLNADILEGHLSSALCHLGNISYRLGEKTDASTLVNRLYTHEPLSESLGRMGVHLGMNGVTLSETPITAGPWLDFDPKTERFNDSDEANALISREYREPFVVPQEV